MSTESFLALYEQLTPKQKQQVYETLKLMLREKQDVYYVICCEKQVVYQGYSIDTAIKQQSDLMDRLIARAKSGKSKLSTAFVCIYSDNKTSNLGLDGGFES